MVGASGALHSNAKKDTTPSLVKPSRRHSPTQAPGGLKVASDGVPSIYGPCGCPCGGCADPLVIGVVRGMGPVMAWVLMMFLFAVHMFVLARPQFQAAWYANALLFSNQLTILAVFGVTRTALTPRVGFWILVISAVLTFLLVLYHVLLHGGFGVLGHGILSDYEFLAEISVLFCLLLTLGFIGLKIWHVELWW